MTLYRIAIINSASFGRHFPEHLEQISKLGTVVREDSATVSAVKLQDPHLVIAGTQFQFTSSVLAQLPSLKAICRHGIGTDNIDIAYANSRNILVTRIPNAVEVHSVAEHAIGLLLALIRKIPDAVTLVKEDKWAQRGLVIGRELFGKKVGIIGLGSVGARIAEITSQGFGMAVSYFDPSVSNQTYKKAASLEELFSENDIIFVAASLTASSKGLVDHKLLQAAQPGTLIVTISRGEVVVEQAITEALKSGRIAGYAADVLSSEPPTEALSVFSKLTNVIITPHIAAYSDETLKRMGDIIVEQARSILLQTGAPIGLVAR